MLGPSIRRVLMTTDTVGGVWTFTLELARQLSRLNMTVLMCALGGYPSQQQVEEAESIPGLCLFPSNYKLEWMESPWLDIEESGRWLLRMEQEYRPDVVHLNSFGHAGLPWTTPVILTAHSCVLSWWEAVKQEQAPPTWERYKELVTKSLAAANLVTAPSKAMALALEKFYGLPVAACQVIPNGRDPNAFRLETKERFVFTAGRLWDGAKNVASVAAIADQLPWPVVAAGVSEDSSGNKLRVPGMQLLGHLPSRQLADWLARAPIFALPARYEPFGLTALEAGLSGCALVLGDIPSQREVWGDAALFVSPGDLTALSATLRALMNDRELREEMSKRSYTRALLFDPARTASLYLDSYQSVAALRKVPCAS